MKIFTALTDKEFDAVAYGKKQTELFRLHCQVSWALIALCMLKKDMEQSDISQFNGLLRDAHSQGKSCFSNDSPDYFWSIYLHKRGEKVLGLGKVRDE